MLPDYKIYLDNLNKLTWITIRNQPGSSPADGGKVTAAVPKGNGADCRDARWSGRNLFDPVAESGQFQVLFTQFL